MRSDDGPVGIHFNTSRRLAGLTGVENLSGGLGTP